jgi:predicted TIM-barrel fold metal-dependent hydrolase
MRGVRTPVAWDRAGRWRVANGPRVLSNRDFRAAAEHLADHELCLEMVIIPEQLLELTDFAATHPRLVIVVNHFATLEPAIPGNAEDWTNGIATLSQV